MKLEDYIRQAELYDQQTATAQSQMFSDLDATELYCPTCREAVPVRKHLLIVLPDGDKYEYRCAYCAEPVGTKIDKQEPMTIIV
ncbi:MAG: cytoplasmic protein [Desulfobacterales bacterium]|nr:cytoplasmic protein [Desulfobacterales bacterium]